MRGFTMNKDITDRQKEILSIISNKGSISIAGIKHNLQVDVGQSTLNRDLAFLVTEGLIEKNGRGRATVYIGFYC